MDSMEVGYIKCHGSGNEFVLFDTVAEPLEGMALDRLAQAACSRTEGIGADGIVLLVRQGETYGMRMFNPDGSEAEMCGNGIRCVARAAEQYIGREQFVLTSGGGVFPTRRVKDIYPGIPTYGVDLAVRLTSADFGFMRSDEKAFVGRTIEALHPELRFTAINVGNPHIVAKVEDIDYALLEQLGRRVTQLHKEFPRGINVSLVKKISDQRIFVATFERGAGITPSCGTAMTSSATAMTLLGECRYEEPIRVENRGGAVVCLCTEDGGLCTNLAGNATYTSFGRAAKVGTRFEFKEEGRFDNEIALYDAFVESIRG